MKNVGLICEGGGTKAAYSAGVLQCLLDHEIYLPYTAGISAGAEILLAYVSRQRERLYVTGVESASQKSAVGIRPLIHEHGLFGIEATCDYIERHAPLDYETFKTSSTQLDIGLYNIETNQVEYFDKSYFDPKEQTLVKAACALLMLAKPYRFQGHLYMDAGLIDMIPIEQSIRRGNEKHIFISTKEENYVRKPAPAWQLRLASLFYPGNKEIRENLKLRHVRYKEQWGKVRELDKAGKALVLRPHKDLGVTRYTTDRELLAPWFQLGYDETKERMDEIRAFIEMD